MGFFLKIGYAKGTVLSFGLFSALFIILYYLPNNLCNYYVYGGIELNGFHIGSGDCNEVNLQIHVYPVNML